MKNTIIKVLEKNEFKFRTLLDDERNTIYNLNIDLRNSQVQTFINVHHDYEYVLITTSCPITVPIIHRIAISEFITRVNRYIYIGSFQLNMEDGRIHYVASYIFNEIESESEDIFTQNLYITFRMMDRYLPGIISVIYSNTSPVEALNNIENTVSPTQN